MWAHLARQSSQILPQGRQENKLHQRPQFRCKTPLANEHGTAINHGPTSPCSPMREVPTKYTQASSKLVWNPHDSSLILVDSHTNLLHEAQEFRGTGAPPRLGLAPLWFHPALRMRARHHVFYLAGPSDVGCAGGAPPPRQHSLDAASTFGEWSWRPRGSQLADWRQKAANEQGLSSEVAGLNENLAGRNRLVDAS